MLSCSTIITKNVNFDHTTDTILVDAITGMNSKTPADGLVCTPAEQTEEMKKAAKLSSSQLESLLRHNITSRDGRLNFVTCYNELGITESFNWSAAKEDACRGENEFIVFMKFKKEFDEVNRFMISMIEGNNRFLCMTYTYALRKVHRLASLTMEEMTAEEMLTVEYLEKRGESINENILTREGDSSVEEGVLKTFQNDETMLVNLNLSIPTQENSDEYTVEEYLRELRGESMNYADSKIDSSKPTDFLVVTDALYNAYPRDDRKEVKRWYDTARIIPDEFTLNGHKLKTKSRKWDPASKKEKGGKRPENWARKVVTLFEDHLDQSMTIDLKKPKDDESRMRIAEFPFRGESYDAIVHGKSDTADLIELNLMRMSIELIPYCMKQHGDSSDDKINQVMAHLVEKNFYNYSGNKRTIVVDKVGLGSETMKGLVTALFIMSMYVVGSIYREQNNTVRLFDTLGRGTLSQGEHWNGLSKFIASNAHY